MVVYYKRKKEKR